MGKKERTAEIGTATQVLDVAERLVQRRGFNGFSYADVAAELELTKAALHYHFASKAELGEALLVRYTDRFMAALDELDTAGGGALAKLQGYVRLYRDVLRDERMCLCGMLAAEYQTLPAPMQRAVMEFLERNEGWLAKVLSEGRTERVVHVADPLRERARVIVSGLEGAMLVARPYGDVARFDAAAALIVASLTAPTSRPETRRPMGKVSRTGR